MRLEGQVAFTQQGRKLKLGVIRQITQVCTPSKWLNWDWKERIHWFVILCSFSNTTFFGERHYLHFLSGNRSSKILSNCVPSTTQQVTAELRFKPSSSDSRVCAHPFTTSVGKSHKRSGNSKGFFPFTPRL